LLGTLFESQAAPQLVEVTIRPLVATATKRLPSADEETPLQLVTGTLFEVQLVPELVEV